TGDEMPKCVSLASKPATLLPRARPTTETAGVNAMDPFLGAVRRGLPAIILAWLAIGAEPSRAQSASSSGGTNEIRIIELQATVEISPARSTTWILTQTNQVLHPFDRLRTGPHSRVALLWSDQSVVPFGALAELEILPPHEQNALSGLHLIKGILSFFHRDT